MSLAIRYANIAAESNSQMREFDGFGPLARAAFNYGPRDPDVKTFRSYFVVAWNRTHMNSEMQVDPPCVLTDPHIDKLFAAYIDSIITERLGNSIVWHHLQPKRLRRR